jgi:hypothetical protein
MGEIGWSENTDHRTLHDAHGGEVEPAMGLSKQVGAAHLINGKNVIAPSKEKSTARVHSRSDPLREWTHAVLSENPV